MNRLLVLALAAVLLPAAALAQSKVVPAQTGQDSRGNPVSTRIDISNVAGTKVDTSNGAATNLRIIGNPSIPTCPVANCPTTPGSGFGGNGGGPTLSSHWVYGSTVTDRTVSEFLTNFGLYVGTGAGNGQKVTSYIGTMQGPGAGSGWSLNTDIVRGACPGGTNSLYGQPGSGIPFGQAGCSAQPGSIGSESTIGYELDLSNWDADSTTHNAFVVGLYVNAFSTFTSTAGISFGNSAGQTSATAPSWHHGIEFSPNTVADATIYDVSNAPFSLLTSGTHSLAAIQDGSTGPVGIKLTGLKSIADISMTANSPAGTSVVGSRSVAAYYDNSTGAAAFKTDGTHTVAHLNLAGSAPAAVNASGTFGLAALRTADATTNVALMAGPGQQVCWANTNACFSYQPSLHKYFISDGTGAIVASIADGGNLVLKGTVTQNGTP